MAAANQLEVNQAFMYRAGADTQPAQTESILHLLLASLGWSRNLG